MDLVTHVKNLTTRVATEFKSVKSVLNNKSDVDHVHPDATTTKSGFMSADHRVKIAGIEQQATRNSSDAVLLSRTNHTGSQPISTVTNLQSGLDDKASTTSLTQHTSNNNNPHNVRIDQLKPSAVRSPSHSAARTASDLAEYRSNSSSMTGAIVFVAPTTSTTIMHQLEFEGMMYSPQQTIFTKVQGYRPNNDANWALLLKETLGTLDVIVRFALTPEGNACVILGDVGTTWSYPHISLSRAKFSHLATANSLEEYSQPWSVVAPVTDLTSYTRITAAITNTAPSGVIPNAGNAVTGTHLSGLSVSEPKIANLAVTYSKIGTSTVGARNLMLSDFTNMIPDGDIQEVGAWTLENGTAIAVTGWTGFRSKGQLTQRAVALGANVLLARSKLIPIQVTDQLSLFGSAVHHNSTQASHKFILGLYDAAGVRTGGFVWATDDYSVSGGRNYSSAYVVPSGVRFVAHEVWSGDNGSAENTAGAVAYGGFSIRHRIDTDLIIDRNVTTAKIAISAVTFNELQNIGTGIFLGRLSTGNGNVESLTGIQVKNGIGLSNVDDTSDINKPVSTATQNALNAKANTTEVLSNSQNSVQTVHINDRNVTTIKIATNAVTFNELQNVGTGVFLGRITTGTGNVESLTVAQAKTALAIDQVNNTSDVNKPISTLTQNALNTKLNLTGGSLSGQLSLADANLRLVRGSNQRSVYNDGTWVGFLGNDGNWDFRVNDVGQVWTAQWGDLNDRIEARASAFASGRISRTGDIITGTLTGEYANPSFRLVNPGVRAWYLQALGGTLRIVDESGGYEHTTFHPNGNVVFNNVPGRGSFAASDIATLIGRFNVIAVSTGGGSLAMTTTNHVDFHWNNGFYYRVDGNAYVLINNAASDAKFKKIKSEVTNGLDVVLGLNPVRYEFNKDTPIYTPSGERAGFIAQDLEKFLPEIVKDQALPEDKEGTIKVLSEDAPIQLIAYLVSSIKILEKRIQEIENGK